MKKPNNLFFLMNNQRFAFFRTLGNRHIQTPRPKRHLFSTMSNLLFVCTFSIFILGYPLVAQATPPLSDDEAAAAQALAERLDLTRPGMEAMADAIAANDHRAVLNVFRARVVERLRAMDFRHAPIGPFGTPFRNADAEMLMGRMTLNDFKTKYDRDWIDTFSRIGPEHYPVLKESGLMAPLGTPIQWVPGMGTSEEEAREITPKETVGWYIGAWGGGGWSFNTSLVNAWWFSGEDEYKDKWLEISAGYFHEFFTAQTRAALKKANGSDSGAFFHLHTAWRMHRSFLPSLALIAKHLDHSTKPPVFEDWLTDSAWSTRLMDQRVEAQAPLTGAVSAEQLETIPAAPLVWIAIGLTEETAPYLIEAYITGDYFFANQNYDGILAVATIALIFDDLKKSRDLESVVNTALPDWAERVIFRDGGALEQDFSYSLGYAAEFTHQAELFASHGFEGAWIDEFRRLASLSNNFWDRIQTPHGLLPCVGNSKYGALAPRKAYPQFSVYFPYSGYAGLRTPGAPGDQLFMMFANSRRSKGHLSPNTGSVHITAYGRDLIAPGGSPSYGLTPQELKWEEAAFDDYAGEHSSLKNSTVIMNGLSQSTFHRGRFLDWLESASDDPVQARWVSNDTFDYLESRWIGYERRVNNSPYTFVEEYNRDIEHHRQVVFFKPAGLWLLVDLMEYRPYTANLEDGREGDTSHLLSGAVETPSPYTFTQIWNFAPPRDEARSHDGFDKTQVHVDGSGKRVYTNDPSGANLELLHFTSTSLTYEMYYGHKDDNQYLGWLVDGRGVPGTPRVDLHTHWQQSREDLIDGRILPLATVIAPSRDTESVIASQASRVEQNGLIAGGELTTKDNHKVIFLSSATPLDLAAGDLVANAELLVLMDLPNENAKQGIILGCTELRLKGEVLSNHPVDFTFLWTEDQLILEPIRQPNSFEMIETSEGVIHSYWPSEAEKTVYNISSSSPPPSPNGVATQSSTGWGGEAARAIDGNTNGNFGQNSVSHTAIETNPWWSLDLGVSKSVSEIKIWNRTDTAPERLSDFWVFVSEKPFASTDPAVLSNSPGVWKHFHDGGLFEASVPIPVGTSGRYIRIQIPGENKTLALAEVQVSESTIPVQFSSFSSWAEQMGLSGAMAEPSADPQGVGFNNLLRYAFGMNLQKINHERLPRFKLFPGTNGQPARPGFSFHASTSQGITFKVEVSTDLKTWQVLPESAVQWEKQATSPDLQEVNVQELDAPASGLKNRFYRLRVETVLNENQPQ